MPTFSLRHGFCPYCFRGEGAKTVRVRSDSARIDEEQRDFSALPLLDLSSAGTQCRTPCRQICMVCANPLAFPCEPDYEEARDAVEQYEADVLELQTEVLHGMNGLLGSLGQSMLKDAERRLQRRLRKIGMAWHPRWHTAVHARCVKKEACGCLLTAGAPGCKAHPVKRLKPRPKPLPRMPDPIPEAKNTRITPASYQRPVVVSQSSWLSKPSSTIAIPALKPAAPAPPPLPSRARPQPAKPNAKLVQAAKGCGKIDSWRRGETQDRRPLDAGSGRPPFDRARYEKEFDPFLHGYFRKNGVDMFRFPDGWVQQVSSPVNKITEDGRLVPG